MFVFVLFLDYLIWYINNYKTLLDNYKYNNKDRRPLEEVCGRAKINVNNLNRDNDLSTLILL